jgi:hypothetical protein
VRTLLGIALLLAGGFIFTQNTGSKISGALAVVGAILLLT